MQHKTLLDWTWMLPSIVLIRKTHVGMWHGANNVLHISLHAGILYRSEEPPYSRTIALLVLISHRNWALLFSYAYHETLYTCFVVAYYPVTCTHVTFSSLYMYVFCLCYYHAPLQMILIICDISGGITVFNSCTISANQSHKRQLK